MYESSKTSKGCCTEEVWLKLCRKLHEQFFGVLQWRRRRPHSVAELCGLFVNRATKKLKSAKDYLHGLCNLEISLTQYAA